MGGRLITIEGLDGAGKTTLAGALAAALADRGVDVEVLREPGGVELSERIRTLVKDPALRVDPRAEALLYAAARAQLVAERVVPLLEAGRWVLLDRFVDSSLAYQGSGRGLGVEAVRAINEFGTGGLRPDRTLLLRVDARTRDARQAARAEAPDRLEREDGSFFAAIGAAYDALAAAEPAARRGGRRGGAGARRPPTIGRVTRRIIASLLACAVAGPVATAGAQEPTTSAPGTTTAAPGTTTPVPGATTSVPGATTTAPPPTSSVPPPTTAPPVTAAPAQAARDTGPDAGDRAAVLLLVVFGGLFLLAAVLWALARWQAWDPPFMARWRHATGEAGWRAGNAWAEFTDWLRIGR
jgi:dTMP kinase